MPSLTVQPAGLPAPWPAGFASPAGPGPEIPEIPPTAQTTAVTAVIFSIVASPGSLVPLHLGYFEQPRKNPRLPRRTVIVLPQSSHVSATTIVLRSGPDAAA